MRKVYFEVWDDSINKNVGEICVVVLQLQNINKKLKMGEISNKELNTVCKNIREVLLFWTGHTYVGVKKNILVQKAFQDFFEALYVFILACKRSKYMHLQNFAKEALYRGIMYRYLGYGSAHENVNIPVEPYFDSTFVSWSKNPRTPYIESKLYGTMTVLTCDVEEPYYAIDLDAFGVVRGG